jgi:hypothetical protein
MLEEPLAADSVHLSVSYLYEDEDGVQVEGEIVPSCFVGIQRSSSK